MPYSPWTDLGNSVSSANGSLQNSLRQLMMLKQQRQQQEQMMSFRQAQLAAQQQVQQAQIAQHNAAAGYDNTKSAHQQLADQAAQHFAEARYAQSMPSGFGAPTQENAQAMPDARVAAAMAMVAGLHGDPRNGFAPEHNIPANAVSLNAATGRMTPGAANVGMGGMVQFPGQDPIRNMRALFAPAGSQPVTQEGDPIGEQVPFHPQNAAQMSPGNISTFMSGLNAGKGYGDTNYDAMASNVIPMLVQAFTNQLPQVKAQSSAPINETVGKRRVRVKSPTGQTGTIEEGDQLPDGWVTTE